MTSNEPRIAALIGAGMVARTHVAALAASATTGKVSLKGIASLGRKRAETLAHEATLAMEQHVVVYEDVAAVAADPDIDFAIVVTPPNARMEILVPLCEAGKHILLEKPIGRTAEESREIVELCENRGSVLGIVFQHRLRAASQKASELVRSGKLGELGLAEFNVPWWREQSYYDEPGRGTYSRDGGGVLISQAIHTIDLGLSLAGPVRSVQALARTTRFHEMEAEDFVVAGLEFTSGAVGSLVASTASFPGSAESIALHFDRASLHLEAGKLRIDWRDGRQELMGEETGTGGGADPMAFTHEWHQAILDDFVLAIGSQRQPVASGRDALAAHELIDAIVRSSRNGKPEIVKS